MAPFQKESSSSSLDVLPESTVDEATTSEGRKPHDAFLHYSNDSVRMRALKMQDANVERAAADCLQSKPRNQERKTRLSFELHPSLILDDLLDEMSGCNVGVSEHGLNHDLGGENGGGGTVTEEQIRLLNLLLTI